MRVLIALSLAARAAGLRSEYGGAGARAVAGEPPSAGGEAAAREAVGHEDRLRLANPAGCANLKSSGVRSLDTTHGVFPVEDFKDMLGYSLANRSGGPCSERVGQLKWCPEPQQEPYLDPSSSVFQELKPYLAGALEGTDESLPLTVAVLQLYGSLERPTSSKAIQTLNFVCGWERLGLLERRSAVFATSEELAGELRRLNPQLRVLYHPGFERAVNLVSEKTKLAYANRVWKLAMSQLLLNMGRDLLLTDMDVYFVRDPVPMLHKAAIETGMEFAAMKDCCWLELNSGFVYYRNTAATRRMLQTALTTERDVEYGSCVDNDQYLLNCGFARAAMEGLEYRILPDTDFSFGSSANLGGQLTCHEESSAPEFRTRWLGDGMPYIWHTSGFSGSYDRELDMFSALGLVDVDHTSGKCLQGARGSDGDARMVAERSARSCSAAKDGILHAGCWGPCQQQPVQAQRLQQGLMEARSEASETSRR